MSLDLSCMRLSKILQGQTCGRVPIWCYWLFACIWLYSRATSIRMKTFKVQRSSLVCLQSRSDILALHFPPPPPPPPLLLLLLPSTSFRFLLKLIFYLLPRSAVSLKAQMSCILPNYGLASEGSCFGFAFHIDR